MKNNWYQGVREWLNYVRNYKANKETDTIIDHRLIEYENKIAKLKDEIEMRKGIAKEHEKLIDKLDERIQIRNDKISTLMKENKSLQGEYLIIMQDNEKLEEKLDLTEKRRRANATTIGAKNRKIRNLEKEIEYIKQNTHEAPFEDYKYMNMSDEEIENLLNILERKSDE